MLKRIGNIPMGCRCYIKIGSSVCLATVIAQHPDVDMTECICRSYMCGYSSSTLVIPLTKHTVSLTIDELLELFEEIKINYPEGKKEEADPDCIHEFIDMFNSRCCRHCGIDEKDARKE